MPPRVLPRAEHTVSRKDIDPDALKVLYRLKNRGFKACLVGGGVRDLLLGRRPKDFDIGTDAHPQQIKKLFRNCFIVGRRFRLCHVRFGRNVVEVSTFRRQTLAEEGDTLIRRDNTFGTPEEDAFRRDFTVNALFYDISTFSVIDYVDGLPDLQQRIIRTIGDPAVRFREDPVRMLRAVALAARLGFQIERDTFEAIRFLRGEIVKSSPARILEEVYKILRQGASRKTFEMLQEVGLLPYLLPEAAQSLAEEGERLLGSPSRLDDYRNAGLVAADDLSNAVLLGTLLVPLGLSLRRPTVDPSGRGRGSRSLPEREDATADPDEEVAAEMAALGHEDEPEVPSGGLPAVLSLPFARRDLDRLRLILAAQSRLRERHATPRVRQMLAGRGYLDDALRWMEVHGGVQGGELAAEWRRVQAGEAVPALEAAAAGPSEPARSGEPGPRRRRRRRRHRRRPGSGPPAASTA
jgi:tRNA nucleotidyltransferase/poly(A) polymerase